MWDFKTYLRREDIAHGISHDDQIEYDPKNVEIKQNAECNNCSNLVTDDLLGIEDDRQMCQGEEGQCSHISDQSVLECRLID